MVMSLQDKRHIVSVHEIDKRERLFDCEIAGTSLGEISIEEIRMREDYAVAVFPAVLLKKRPEPSVLTAAKGRRSSVKAYVQILSALENGFKPVYRRSYIISEIKPAVPEDVMIAQNMKYPLVA